MAFTFGLFVSILLLAGLLASAFMPGRLLLTVYLMFASFQFYLIPVAGTFLSLSHISALGMWRFFFNSGAWNYWWYRAAATLLLIQIVSISWSPNPFLGVRSALYFFPFIFAVPFVFDQIEKNSVFLLKLIRYALISTAIQALLVIIFRVLPTLEIAFLGSPVAKVFISANVLAELFGGAFTILDPTKSGGFFVNANVASCFMGFVGLLSFSLAQLRGGDRVLLAVAGLNLIAVLFAGSKAGVLLLTIALFAYYIYSLVLTNTLSLGKVVAMIFSAAILMFGVVFFVDDLLTSTFAENSAETLESRFAMWTFAWRIFVESPMTGLGFGGWELRWPVYAIAVGSNPLFPPHNGFLIMFVQSGILAVLASLVFIFSILRFVASTVAANTGDHRTQKSLVLILFAFAWYFIQSQVENYGFIGEPHLTPVVIIGLALIKMCGGVRGAK